MTNLTYSESNWAAILDNELDVGGVKSRDHIINLGAYWKDQIFEYSSGVLSYRGCHFLHNPGTDDDMWSIWKYTYSDGDLTRIEGPLSGAWDSRAALDWGS